MKCLIKVFLKWIITFKINNLWYWFAQNTFSTRAWWKFFFSRTSGRKSIPYSHKYQHWIYCVSMRRLQRNYVRCHFRITVCNVQSKKCPKEFNSLLSNVFLWWHLFWWEMKLEVWNNSGVKTTNWLSEINKTIHAGYTFFVIRKAFFAWESIFLT